MNKVRTIIIDGVEIQTSLTAVEIANLQQENQELKEEINKISKKELKIMQMLRSIECCTLTKERIDQIEEVMFELGDNNYEI